MCLILAPERKWSRHQVRRPGGERFPRSGAATENALSGCPVAIASLLEGRGAQSVGLVDKPESTRGGGNYKPEI